MPGSIIKVFPETFVEEPQGRRRRGEEEKSVYWQDRAPGPAATQHSSVDSAGKYVATQILPQPSANVQLFPSV